MSELAVRMRKKLSQLRLTSNLLGCVSGGCALSAACCWQCDSSCAIEVSRSKKPRSRKLPTLEELFDIDHSFARRLLEDNSIVNGKNCKQDIITYDNDAISDTSSSTETNFSRPQVDINLHVY